MALLCAPGPALSQTVAPGYCHRFETRRLTVKRTVHSQVVWFQSDSIFGTDQTRSSQPAAASRSRGSIW